MGFRHVVLRFRTCAEARAREAMAARAQTRSCVRARAFREEARAATGAAQARARSVLRHIIKGQRRIEAAADVTGRQLRRASDMTVSTVLRIAYGESAPATPSPMEILKIIYEKAKAIESALTTVEDLIKAFQRLDPYLRAAIVGFLLAPFAFLENAVPSAPEPICPFLGIQGLPFDIVTTDEALDSLGYVTKVTILTFGCLCLSPIVGLYHMWNTDDVYTPDKPIDSSFVASLIPYSAVKKLKKMALMIIADSLAREDDVACLCELFHLIETIGSETTVNDMKDALGRLASELAKRELKIMMNAPLQDIKQVMGTRGAYNVLMMTTKLQDIDLAYLVQEILDNPPVHAEENKWM